MTESNYSAPSVLPHTSDTLRRQRVCMQGSSRIDLPVQDSQFPVLVRITAIGKVALPQPAEVVVNQGEELWLYTLTKDSDTPTRGQLSPGISVR